MKHRWNFTRTLGVSTIKTSKIITTYPLYCVKNTHSSLFKLLFPEIWFLSYVLLKKIEYLRDIHEAWFCCRNQTQCLDRTVNQLGEDVTGCFC